jgi:hypothetical protein
MVYLKAEHAIARMGQHRASWLQSVLYRKHALHEENMMMACKACLPRAFCVAFCLGFLPEA